MFSTTVVKIKQKTLYIVGGDASQAPLIMKYPGTRCPARQMSWQELTSLAGSGPPWQKSGPRRNLACWWSSLRLPKLSFVTGRWAISVSVPSSRVHISSPASQLHWTWLYQQSTIFRSETICSPWDWAPDSFLCCGSSNIPGSPAPPPSLRLRTSRSGAGRVCPSTRRWTRCPSWGGRPCSRTWCTAHTLQTARSAPPAGTSRGQLVRWVGWKCCNLLDGKIVEDVVDSTARLWALVDVVFALEVVAHPGQSPGSHVAVDSDGGRTNTNTVRVNPVLARLPGEP